MTISSKNRHLGCLLGLAVGDALGTTVEFKSRGSFAPLADMVGGGPFGLEPGQWTDDTSMALCLADSLVACRGFDAADQMQRYVRWRDEGYLSSRGVCFDIGNTVQRALFGFSISGEPFSGSTHPRSAGNGCIMRLAPVPMAFHRNPERAIHLAAQSSRTTHGATACLDACRLFAAMLVAALNGADKAQILGAHAGVELTSRGIAAIAGGSYHDKAEADIRGSGYVVESLEAALWCFARTNNYRDAVLTAANLGDDADTTAAICGQLAGAYYGVEGIPQAWLDVLAQRELIEGLAGELFSLAGEVA